MRATLNGEVIAESQSTVEVEGNFYFPPSSLKMQYLTATDLETHCPWKGEASYYDIEVGDKKLNNAAWTYKDPSEKAAEIKDHVAFYPEVTIGN